MAPPLIASNVASFRFFRLATGQVSLIQENRGTVEARISGPPGRAEESPSATSSVPATSGAWVSTPLLRSAWARVPYLLHPRYLSYLSRLADRQVARRHGPPPIPPG